MVAFVARDESAVVAALRSGVVPANIQIAPVFVERSGRLVCIEPTVQVDETTVKELEGFGFEVLEEASRTERAAAALMWAEAVPARPGPEPETPLLQVLFLEARERFLSLAGELVRLGCHRQEVCFFRADDDTDYCVVLATAPPYYVVACTQGSSTALAFVQTAPGVWIEYGACHPLAGQLAPPDGQLLLIAARAPWRHIPDGPWTSIDDRTDVAVPQTVQLAPLDVADRLKVELRLVRHGRPSAPSLWVLRRDAVARVDELLITLPESVLEMLAFAVFETDGERMVVLRTRRLGHSLPGLDLPRAERYAQVAQIENLYLPVGTAVAPPLRWERLANTLAPITEQLAWAVPISGEGSAGSFRIESAHESAFSPMLDWVDYVTAADRAALKPWLDHVGFEFDEFVSIGVEWDERPESPDESRESTPRRPTQRERHETAVAARVEADRSEPIPSPTAALPDVSHNPSELAIELDRLEAAFRDLDAPAEAPERGRLWLELAAAYTAAGRVKDAGLSWAHALWEVEPGADRQHIARMWADAERELLDHDPLEQPDPPTRHDVRAAATQVIAAGYRGESAHTEGLRSWLVTHDSLLDTRSFWLLREVLAELSDDQLARVRAQDAVLHRLRGGMSHGDEVPAFIRMWSDGPGPQGHALEILADSLDRTLAVYQNTTRRRSAVEADSRLTDGYVHLLFSWGFARIGRDERAAAELEHANQAHDAVPADDAVHRVLRRAFRLRIQQALDGLPIETPLPAGVMAELDELNRYMRYKVDRLRQVSVILDWTHNLDPFGSFAAPTTEPPYAGLDNAVPEEIAAAVERILRDASVDFAALDGACALLQVLPEFHALDLIPELVDRALVLPPSERVLILENAMLVAARCESDERVSSIADEFVRLVEGPPPGNVVAPALALARVSSCLRRARRAEAVLAVLRAQLAGMDEQSPESAVARMQIAAAMANLGDDSEVEATSARALVLRDLNMTGLRMIRQVAQTLSHTSPAQARAGVETLLGYLPAITDSFNTNSHFCLSVLHLMESIVLGLARADLSLSRRAREFIEQDEHRIRRRIFAGGGSDDHERRRR